VSEAPAALKSSMNSKSRIVFYFNKLGCLGSILVSIAMTAVLVLAVRSFSG
jgi:hypothetical protein